MHNHNTIEAGSLTEQALKRSVFERAIEAGSLTKQALKRLASERAIEAGSLSNGCQTGSLKRLTLSGDTGYLDSTVPRAPSRSVWLRLAGTSPYGLGDVKTQVI